MFRMCARRRDLSDSHLRAKERWARLVWRSILKQRWRDRFSAAGLVLRHMAHVRRLAGAEDHMFD